MHNQYDIYDLLIAAMRDVFGSDERRIQHALRVLDHANDILAKEGGSELVVRAAAILHDVGIVESERKYGSSAGRYQEIEGPPVARRAMEKLGLDGHTVEHVCAIVGDHHSARKIDTLESRIVRDADWLVNIADDFAGKSKKRLKSIIDRVFKTKAGKEKAYQLFLSSQTEPK